MSEIFIYDTKYEGEDAKSKIARVRSQMLERGVDVLKTFVPEEAAWLLNLRGSGAGEEYADDLKKFTPVFLCELEMTEDNITLYVNQEISEEVSGYLADLGVSVKQKELEERDINIEEDKTLISDLMMIKNDVQIKNMKDVFFDDGLVWMKFIRWIKKEAKSGSLTEIDVKKKMEELRREVADYVMPSFETIPAYNESAADIHYHVTEESNKVIKPEGLIMVDTGGQYLRGTTDTTRTIALGPVTDKMKEMYTAVLKGHIDVALAKVEEGTTGDVLDDIARKYIREKGLDYKHGTGHGLGHFLNVHEYPRRVFNENTKIYENMSFSNEPGVYLEGEFGVRIENVVRTVKKNSEICLENFTLVPYETELILVEELSEDEKEYLRDYHDNLLRVFKDHLNDEEYKWLEAQKI
ncbi:MAG: M24 family metallopeptidase [Eubacterium sp.]|nr:M24 family metallopeptidase [Eubacterium sp.]